MLPSGDSQMQGGNIGERQDSPRQQEKPDDILQVNNKQDVFKTNSAQRSEGVVFFDQQEYERRVKVVVQGKLLESSVRDAIGMLNEQLGRLGNIPLDAMRNNSSKLVNQDMDIAPLEEMNIKAANTLHEVATNIHCSKLMSHYNEELTKADRKKWQMSETDKAMMAGADKACKYIEKIAGKHLTKMVSRMEWFPVTYHLADKAALVAFPILGYYTGKHHLDDTMLLMWLIAAMPIVAVTAIWAVNELWGWLEKNGVRHINGEHLKYRHKNVEEH